MTQTDYRPDLSKVSILIKTLMRDLHLFDSIRGVVKMLPECQMIIVDDGDHLGLPHDYGVDGVPRHFLAQLVYPFRVLAERIGIGRKPGVGAATTV